MYHGSASWKCIIKKHWWASSSNSIEEPHTELFKKSFNLKFSIRKSAQNSKAANWRDARKILVRQRFDWTSAAELALIWINLVDASSVSPNLIHTEDTSISAIVKLAEAEAKRQKQKIKRREAKGERQKGRILSLFTTEEVTGKATKEATKETTLDSLDSPDSLVSSRWRNHIHPLWKGNFRRWSRFFPAMKREYFSTLDGGRERLKFFHPKFSGISHEKCSFSESSNGPLSAWTDKNFDELWIKVFDAIRQIWCELNSITEVDHSLVIKFRRHVV